MTDTGKTGIRCYVFDTVSSRVAPEQKRSIDTRLVKLYHDILVRRAMEEEEGN